MILMLFVRILTDHIRVDVKRDMRVMVNIVKVTVISSIYNNINCNLSIYLSEIYKKCINVVIAENMHTISKYEIRNDQYYTHARARTRAHTRIYIYIYIYIYIA